MGVAYLSDVAARLVHEHHNIGPNVVRLVNDTAILVVNQAGDIAVWVVPQCDDGFGGTTR